MAKRSHKRRARAEKDNAGCMWGLISMFDFRQGNPNQKLLSDRKQGSGRHVVGSGDSSTYNLLTNLEEKHEDVDANLAKLSVVEESKAGRADLGTTSVKALMEKEMTNAQPSKRILCAVVEQISSNLEVGVQLEKNLMQTNKNGKVASNLQVNDLRGSASLESHRSNCPDSSDRFPFNIDLVAFMEEFCNDNHQHQEMSVDKTKIDSCSAQKSTDHWKHYILQKALGGVAEAFLSQKYAKQLTDSGSFHQSKELIDALEILNSNKELFLKLLEDPNSLLFKHIQDLQNAQEDKLSTLESCKIFEGSDMLDEEIGSSRQCQEPTSHKLQHKQTGYKFFRRKDKSKGSNLSKGSESSQALNRIVVLKPSPARIENHSTTISPSSSPQSNYSLRCEEDSRRVASHFSLKEIKRRLRHVIGENRKERHLISTEGVLHRIPFGFQDSDDISIARESSASAKRREKKSKTKESQSSIKYEIAHPLREPFPYKEATKHIVDKLSTGDENERLRTRQTSKTLGRILSLPEYNLLSPRFSPGREKEQFKEANATNHSCPLEQNLEDSPCTDSNEDVGLKLLDSNSALLDSQPQDEIDIKEELNRKGSMEVVERAEIIHMEACSHLDLPSETNSNGSETFTEDGPFMLSHLESSSEEPQQVTSSVSISPSSLLIQKIEAPESLLEKPERPSPVSVLEPFFLDDLISPGSSTIEHAELPIQPRQIYFEENDSSEVVLNMSDSETDLRTWGGNKEAKFKYVRTVLKASGLTCHGISERRYLSDWLLEPSLFDEVENSSEELPEDTKLLFDCINEVLIEIHERLFSCTPWVSFIEPKVRPIPVGENFIQEVCKGIDWQFLPQVPRSLDQIVGKDMEGDIWMELRSETESVGIEMGDAILEDLIEETVLKVRV